MGPTTNPFFWLVHYLILQTSIHVKPFKSNNNPYSHKHSYSNSGDKHLTPSHNKWSPFKHAHPVLRSKIAALISGAAALALNNDTDIKSNVYREVRVVKHLQYFNLIHCSRLWHFHTLYSPFVIPSSVTQIDLLDVLCMIYSQCVKIVLSRTQILLLSGANYSQSMEWCNQQEYN